MELINFVIHACHKYYYRPHPLNRGRAVKTNMQDTSVFDRKISRGGLRRCQLGMEETMEDTFGIISFWIRMFMLSCILCWNLLGMIVKRAVLAIRRA